MKHKIHNVTHVKVKAIFHIYAVLYYASFFTLFFFILWCGPIKKAKSNISDLCAPFKLQSAVFISCRLYPRRPIPPTSVVLTTTSNRNQTTMAWRN